MGLTKNLSSQWAVALLDAMPDGFAHCRMVFEGSRPVDFFYLRTNPAFERLTGLSNVVGKSITELVPGLMQSNPEVFETYGRVVLSGKPEKFEVFAKPMNRWLSISATPTEEGCFAAIFNNTTVSKMEERALREAQEALLQSRAQLDAALASTTDAIFISDAQGRFFEFNDAFATFHRFKDKDQCAKTLAEYPDILDVFFVTGEPAPLEMWAVPRALRGETVTNAEYVLRRKDTGETWVGSFSLSPVRNKEGLIVGSVVVARDITEKRKVEEALLESEERVRKIFENTPDGILFGEPDGTIRAANPAACNMLGRTEAELREGGRNMVVDQSDPRIALSLEVRSQKGEFRGELRYKRKDGTVFPVDLTSSIFSFKEGGPLACIMVFKDITDRKRVEEDRIILSKLESTGVLAGGIAHDFNNLLQALLLNVELAKSAACMKRDTAIFMESIRQSGLAAQSLTKQLIAFAKGGAPVRRPVRLQEVIRASVTLSLSGSNVRGKLFLEENLNWTDADEGQIGQVIRNLVINAREAMRNGGEVIVRAQNVLLGAEEISTLSSGNYVRVTVSDQGSGIPAEALSKIFDPYFTSKTEESKKGTGLGLTICHTIVKRHEGAITVQSKVGEGTTFQVYLPICPAPALAWPRKQRSEPPQPLSNSRKVLVMEDEDCMREAVCSVLQDRTFEVEACKCGNEALDLYLKAKDEGRPFDVVILDLTVRGGMGGQETLLELRKINPELKAIVMSGYSDDPVLVNPERFGFNACMEKTFDANQLCATVIGVIG